MSEQFTPGYDDAALGEVWRALDALAEVWKSSAVVQRQRKHVADPFSTTENELSELRTHVVELSNYTLVREPLMLFTGLRTASEQPMASHLSEVFESVAWRSLLADAETIESLFIRLLTFVRSRLPGYPLLKAPQLARDSWLTTREIGWRVPWLVEHAQWAMHQQPHASVSRTLEVDPETHDARVNDLLQALSATSAWTAFASARRALTASDHEELRTAKRQLQFTLRQIDDHEPHLAMGRLNYRQYHTEAVPEHLSGSARTFANSFMDVEELVNVVMVEVFGQLVMREAPILIGEYTDFSATAEKVEFNLNGYVSTGSIVIAPSSPTKDAVQVQSVSIYVSDGNSGTRIDGMVLAGTSLAWGV